MSAIIMALLNVYEMLRYIKIILRTITYVPVGMLSMAYSNTYVPVGMLLLFNIIYYLIFISTYNYCSYDSAI